MRVDKDEGKRLIWRRTANSEHRYQRLALQEVVRIVDREDTAPIHFDRGRVVNERVLFFAVRTSEARSNDFVVLTPIYVHIRAQKVVEEIVVLRANLLNRHDVKILDDRGQRRHDVRLRSLRIAEDLNIERRDADCRAAE